MMKQVLTAFMLAIAGIGLSAQDKVLSIYYISHSPATNEKALLSALNIAQPLDKSESAIFYLANSERPLVSYVNLPFDGVPVDEIIMELNTKSSHEVYPEIDCRRLCEIFDNVDSVRDEFAVVNLNYYIDSMFWEFYRESVIAKMYYVRIRCQAISGEMGYVLQADSFYQEGIVKTQNYVNAQKMQVSIERPAGEDEAWTFDWSEGSFSPQSGYPSCVFFYQDRLGFAGSNKVYADAVDA